VADDFRDIESRLLRSETFNRTSLTQTLESQASLNVSPCDTHSQRALLLMEMPLAEAALRSGAAGEFDRRIQSLEARSRQVLGCTPRESFVWLLAFNLEVLHGRLNEQSFNLLAMSYETSPNEASFSSLFAMDSMMMQPAPTSRHPGRFVHCCKPRSNSSTSPGRKNSRTHCRDSAPDELFRNPGFLLCIVNIGNK